jgi:isoleucyl-tRNA synthetase
LPANQAVCLHPDLDYEVIQTEINGATEVLVLAAALSAECLGRFNATHSKVLTTVKGQVLEGVQLQHPFYDRHVPVILGEHVTTEAGTGAVHTAPGHGVDDFIVGQRYNLPVDNPVGNDGCFVAGTELFRAWCNYWRTMAACSIIISCPIPIHTAGGTKLRLSFVPPRSGLSVWIRTICVKTHWPK